MSEATKQPAIDALEKEIAALQQKHSELSATLVAETDWREKLQVAMDALKERTPPSYQAAFEIFDQLDQQRPGWQLEVPWHAKQHTKVRKPEIGVKRIIAAMLWWAGVKKTEIAKAFGVSGQTADHYVRRGERAMANDRRWLYGYLPFPGKLSYERQWGVEYSTGGYQLETYGIEDDYKPADERREKRRSDMEHLGVVDVSDFEREPSTDEHEVDQSMTDRYLNGGVLR